MNKPVYWKPPEVRGVGFFSDSSIYIEVLQLARKSDYFTKNSLETYLVNHVKGLTYKDKISNTGIDNLIRELISFGWITYSANLIQREEKSDIFSKSNLTSIYSITPKGVTEYDLYKEDKLKFLDDLIIELYRLYTLPAWFIQRLWDLNPIGQGLIVIPSPPRKWNPTHKEWNDNQWNKEFEKQVVTAYERISQLLPNSFPLELDNWLTEVQKRWDEIANTKARKDNAIIKHTHWRECSKGSLVSHQSHWRECSKGSLVSHQFSRSATGIQR